MFQNTWINVTTEGRRHLGTALGLRDFLEDYVNEKAEQWVEEVIKLSEFANSQPQACFAAYTFGLKHRCTYFHTHIARYPGFIMPSGRCTSVQFYTIFNWA